MRRRGSALLVVLVGMLVAVPALAAGRPPTEDAIKKSIERAFTETYVDPVVWKITRITCEFGPIKIGKQTKKQVQYGKVAEPVWPVKVEVKVTQYRDAAAWKTTTRGGRDDDVFLFYEDAFGDWRFKTGSL